MAENLAYLPYVNTPYEYSNDEPRFYVFNNEQRDVIKAKELGTYRDFGVLYNQVAAKMSCPEGWHLPSDAEWEQLVTYINKKSKTKFRHIDDTWYDIGNRLKSRSGWIVNQGSDSYKFNALPGGCIQFGDWQTKKGSYDFLGSSATWWSSSRNFHINSWMRWLDDDDSFKKWDFERSYGYSVRCIKNNN
jgi:uncharacterized protein (TIGR02145 family)